MTGTIKITTLGRHPMVISNKTFGSGTELRKLMYFLKGQSVELIVRFDEPDEGFINIATVRFDLIECIEDKLNEMENEY